MSLLETFPPPRSALALLSERLNLPSNLALLPLETCAADFCFATSSSSLEIRSSSDDKLADIVLLKLCCNAVSVFRYDTLSN